MKFCSKCEEFKDFEKFGKNKSRKDWLSFRCRLCSNEAQRESSVKHKEKNLERSRNYYKNNTDLCNLRNKISKEKHKEDIRKRAKAHQVLILSPLDPCLTKYRSTELKSVAKSQ